MKGRPIRLLLVMLLLGLGVGLGLWYWTSQREARFDNLIVQAGKRYGVEPALVKAVIWRESRFDESARGSAGEIGLMQVGDLAAHEWADAERLRQFSSEHLSHPQTNIMAGTFYLGKLLRRYRQTDQAAIYALGDYNAGRTRVLRWNKGSAGTNGAAFLEQIDYPGTRHYIVSILERYDSYKRAGFQ